MLTGRRTVLNAEQIKQKKVEIVQRYGDWTAHNIYLGHGIYTFDPTRPDFDSSIVSYTRFLGRALQIASDLTDQPLSDLRVLDLASLEGVYGIEFALHGAQVVGIEIREANLQKANFAKEVLSLGNISFAQDDVRNLCIEKYGQFDVVLCIGILYHLDAPDVFHFVEKISEMCRHATIIDTHVGLNPNSSYYHKGRKYYGWIFTEHETGSSQEAKAASVCASIDNEKSFWFTRSSLFNLLADVGFTSVYDCYNPACPGQLDDRDTLVAVKGPQQHVRCLSMKSESVPVARWSEMLKLAMQAREPTEIAASGMVEGATINSPSSSYSISRFYECFVDGADQEHVWGWAWDKQHAATTVAVDIYDGDQLIASGIPASDHRADLFTYTKDKCCHAFDYKLPGRVRDGRPHRISVRVSGTARNAYGSPRVIEAK